MAGFTRRTTAALGAVLLVGGWALTDLARAEGLSLKPATARVTLRGPGARREFDHPSGPISVASPKLATASPDKRAATTVRRGPRSSLDLVLAAVEHRSYLVGLAGMLAGAALVGLALPASTAAPAAAPIPMSGRGELRPVNANLGPSPHSATTRAAS